MDKPITVEEVPAFYVRCLLCNAGLGLWGNRTEASKHGQRHMRIRHPEPVEYKEEIKSDGDT